MPRYGHEHDVVYVTRFTGASAARDIIEAACFTICVKHYALRGIVAMSTRDSVVVEFTREARRGDARRARAYIMRSTLRY